MSRLCFSTLRGVPAFWTLWSENAFVYLEQLIMATISENDLLIRYDQKDQKLVIYRLTSGGAPSGQSVLHTEYPLSKLKAMTLGEAGRLIGEDVLVSISGTRQA